MNTTLIIALAALVVLAGVVVLTAARRRETTGVLSRETRSRDEKTKRTVSSKEFERESVASRSTALAVPQSVAVAPWTPPDPEAIGVSRRQFFNRATVTLMSAGLGGFGAAVLGFLWKGAEGGFGSKINAGKVDDIIAGIRSNNGFLYLPEARAWVTEYPKESLAKAEAIYASQAPVFAGMSSGIVALYQKCPHLGCRVPTCATSQWFECPCHGSQFNRVGEKKGGPAPRGMDRFAVSINNGSVVIDTGAVFGGPAIGTNTTGQEAEGPHCVGAGGH
ncbi:MAG: Rieske 2Fe-2S domain-containing protein [Actinomycetota bacterium]|jgi:cytochrome b6-f complex iron-sulfur subunit|nr:Rieske 2Fe-2S domain-containing protein [Actinomycetota bacterium]MDP4641783.1 Rieske 2Fe-2S domain-containing protein [Ilumatobacteraceae bacterium]